MAKKTALGIDIGYDQLKLAQVTNGTVVKTAIAQMPENLLKEGRFTSLEAMGSLIRQTVKENGIKTNRAAVILPNELVYVKNIDVPLMTDEQLAYNLPFEFHDYITGEVQNYVFDYAVLGVDEPDNTAAEQSEEEPLPGAEEGESLDAGLHLMAVGIERTVVEDIQTMLRKAGLRLVKTAPALCTYISLIREMQESLFQVSDEFGILDLGYNSIDMYMYKGDQHVATREFEMGLSALDDIVADIYGIEKHLAHTYVMSNYDNCLEKEECVNYYDNIAVELMRAINFYEFSNQGSSLSDLWLCGGGAVNKALVNAIDETLGAELHSAAELVPGGDAIEGVNNFVQAVGVTLEI